nr:ABC transporter ATP-binding protein [Bacilli bacterium]
MNDIQIRNLKKSFGDDLLYEKVNLDFESKGFYAIIGDSGSGKSTLLELISGIYRDYSGDIRVLGREMRSMDESEAAFFRLKNIGYIRQSYDLLEQGNALDNVILPLASSGEGRSYKAKRKAKDLLISLGLKDKCKSRVSSLSGGEKQRVALARALINDPKIILADEPSGALDEENAELIYSTLAKISKNRLVIVVSHDMNLTHKYAEKILILSQKQFRSEDNSPLVQEGNLLQTNFSDRSDKKKSCFSTWFNHSLSVLKSKKLRTLLSISVLSFSLISFGLSLYISRDLKNELKNAFTSLTGEGNLVMEKETSSDNYFDVVSAAKKENIEVLQGKFPSEVEDYGITYLANFENYFSDCNQGYLELRGRRSVIPSFSIRTVNDYLWLDKYLEKDIYPEVPSVLEEEQIVLGIPFSTMANICLELRIERTYESLGNYLSYRYLELIVELEN